MCTEPCGTHKICNISQPVPVRGVPTRIPTEHGTHCTVLPVRSAFKDKLATTARECVSIHSDLVLASARNPHEYTKNTHTPGGWAWVSVRQIRRGASTGGKIYFPRDRERRVSSVLIADRFKLRHCGDCTENRNLTMRAAAPAACLSRSHVANQFPWLFAYLSQCQSQGTFRKYLIRFRQRLEPAEELFKHSWMSVPVPLFHLFSSSARGSRSLSVIVFCFIYFEYTQRKFLSHICVSVFESGTHRGSTVVARCRLTNEERGKSFTGKRFPV